MVESINSALSSSMLSMLQSTTKSSDSESTTKQSIITELKNNAMAASKSAQEIADEYGITLSEAQEILDELNDSNDTEDDTTTITTNSSEEYPMDNPIPEGSTVSYHV